MATPTADVYLSAVKFAHDTLDVTNNKDLLAKSLSEFTNGGFADTWWDFWSQHMSNARTQMQEWKRQEDAKAAQAAKAATVAPKTQ